eukprot:364234-Chlamydomonas_euryale.AAC.5
MHVSNSDLDRHAVGPTATVRTFLGASYHSVKRWRAPARVALMLEPRHRNRRTKAALGMLLWSALVHAPCKPVCTQCAPRQGVMFR